jgi:hypothetical protein
MQRGGRLRFKFFSTPKPESGPLSGFFGIFEFFLCFLQQAERN